MQPPQPLAPAASRPLLRPAEHPELSDVLTHFCGRGRDRADLPASIQQLSSADRLENILWEQRLRTFVTFSRGDPAVCFTEAGKAGIKFMIKERGYEPWALLFRRQDVYDAGGGPIWHARPTEYDLLCQDPHLRSWAVRFEAGHSDWLEEREWRIVRTADIPLSELRPIGLVVGNSWWTGARHEYLLDPSRQPRFGYYYPPLGAGLPRYLWNPALDAFTTLPALF